jgi:hypothetical protein
MINYIIFILAFVLGLNCPNPFKLLHRRKTKEMNENNFDANFRPIRTYNYYDGDRSFSLIDKNGNLHFAHWLSEHDSIWKYLVIPIDQETRDSFEANQISYYDLFASSKSFFIVNQNIASGEIVSVVSHTWDEVLSEYADCLPRKGIFYDVKFLDKTWYEKNIPHNEGEVGAGVDKEWLLESAEFEAKSDSISVGGMYSSPNKSIIKYVESENKEFLARVELSLSADETGEFVMSAEQVEFLKKIRDTLDCYHADAAKNFDWLSQNNVLFYNIVVGSHW